MSNVAVVAASLHPNLPSQESQKTKRNLSQKTKRNLIQKTRKNRNLRRRGSQSQSLKTKQRL